jgi:hypothetical protein
MEHKGFPSRSNIDQVAPWKRTGEMVRCQETGGVRRRREDAGKWTNPRVKLLMSLPKTSTLECLHRSVGVMGVALSPWTPGRTSRWRGQSSPKDGRFKLQTALRKLSQPRWRSPATDNGFRGKYYKGIYLGQDILQAYYTFVNKGRQTMLLEEEDVSLWSPGRPSGRPAW